MLNQEIIDRNLKKIISDTKLSPKEIKDNKERSKAMATLAPKAYALIEIARREARKLGANGPVTMDDVTRVMAAAGYDDLRPSKTKKKNWKGSVFKTSEWTCIGSTPSTFAHNHGKEIKLWMLKTKLAELNGMNGLSWMFSAFNIARLMKQHDLKEESVWAIGTNKLHDDFIGVKQLYGIDVVYVEGGTGAILIPKSWINDTDNNSISNNISMLHPAHQILKEREKKVTKLGFWSRLIAAFKFAYKHF